MPHQHRQFCERGRGGHLLLTLLLASVVGCSGTRPVKWQETMGRYYPRSSVRPDQPPRHLWTLEEEDLLQRRVGFADFVAVGTAHVVTRFAMLGAPRGLTLCFRPREIFFGDKKTLDQQGELMLPLDQSEDDFLLAVKTYSYLPGSRYLLVLKYPPHQNGRRPAARWALYRPEESLVAEIRAMFLRLRKR